MEGLSDEVIENRDVNLVISAISCQSSKAVRACQPNLSPYKGDSTEIFLDVPESKISFMILLILFSAVHLH